MQAVSVIIPAFNRVEFLPRAIDSVLNQEGTVPEIEVILVDDGSTDGTGMTIRKRYPHIHYLRQEHTGVSAARNAGIRAAAGDWIALLDSDDAWHPRKLAVQSALLGARPANRVVHCDETWLRNGIHLNQKKKHRKRGGRIFRYCLPLCVISPSAAVIHKGVFEDVGYFDETLPVCEDYELWLRVCSKYPVLFSGEKLVFKHGGHDDQLSRRYWGMDRFRIRAIAGMIRRGGLAAVDRDCALRTLHEKIGIYLSGAEKRGNTECVEEFRSLLSDFPLADAAAP